MKDSNEDKKELSPFKITLRSMFSFNITAEERKATVDRLIEESRADNAFYILLMLSTIITVSGLVTDNTTVVLGGMLVAPLLTPILSFGMAIVTTQSISLRRAANIIINSILLVLITAVTTTLILNIPESSIRASYEINSRIGTSIVALFVALASGLAAAFAWARPKLSAALPGVAVATSLLPPLAVSGIGLTLLEKNMFFGSLQLFLANLLLIILASSMMFSLFGFFTARKEEEKKLVEEIKEIKEEKKELVEKIKSEEEKKEKLVEKLTKEEEKKTKK